MKPKITPWLLRTALPCLGGLLCGLALRHLRGVDTAPPASPGAAAGRVQGRQLPSASPDEWTRLLEHYRQPPPPPAPGSDELSSGQTAAAGADAFLRMLLNPVDQASIRQGIDFLNATDILRHHAVLSSLFSFWAARNPDAAQAAAPALRVPQARDTLIWLIFQARTAADPEDALAKAKALPSPDLRAPAMHAVASTLKPDRIPDILHLSMRDRHPPQQMSFNSFEKDLLRNWAKSDLQAPVRFVVRIEDPVWRKVMLETALQVRDDLWSGGGNRPEKIPTLRELAQDPRNIPGISGQLAELLSSAVPEAADILSIIPDAPGRRQVMADAALEMLWKMGAEKNVIPAEVQDAAARNLENLAAEAADRGWSREFSQVLLETATRGEIPQLAAAARWISDHDPARLEQLVREASARVPHTTAEWLDTLPSGADRDLAVSLFAEIHATTDSARATAWAESITDPALRASTLTIIRRGATVSLSP